jgi:hypothetical protein
MTAARLKRIARLEWQLVRDLDRIGGGPRLIVDIARDQ